MDSLQELDGAEVKPVGPPPWLRENLAQFYVDQEALERDTESLMQAMSRWLVLRAEYHYDRQAMHYIVAGESLPRRLRGETPAWISLRFRHERVEKDGHFALNRIFDGFDL